MLDRPKKKIAILGSTGSIGESTLDVIRKFPNHFQVVYLTAKSRVNRLLAQAIEFKPKAVAVFDRIHAQRLKRELEGKDIDVLVGESALEDVVTRDDTDFVVNALVGFSGLKPTISALKADKVIGMANKESLVAAGDFVVMHANKSQGRILPIDSEHSAIFQCLLGEARRDVNKLIITASGGPFLYTSKDSLSKVTVSQALNHPNWVMGEKITIDSATMINKGFEVIEAHWLFDMSVSRIQVVIHPQSIIHSMVEFTDGCLKAHLSVPDMKSSIQYALMYPKREQASIPRLNWENVSTFTFLLPDLDKFPCLRLSYQAIEQGGALPLILNAANEIAVEAFLKERISFTKIQAVIEDALTKFEDVSLDKDVDLFVKLDKEVRNYSFQSIECYSDAI